MERVPQARLTHPTCIIALLLHFFHYCYRLPFQYLWLGVRVPVEFTLWRATSHYYVCSLTHIHTTTFLFPPLSRVIFLLFEEQR